MEEFVRLTVIPFNIAVGSAQCGLVAVAGVLVRFYAVATAAALEAGGVTGRVGRPQLTVLAGTALSVIVLAHIAFSPFRFAAMIYATWRLVGVIIPLH